ncbi:MAG: hypothetical protein ACLFV7_10025 [Phycisphaerae bacterium]
MPDEPLHAHTLNEAMYYLTVTPCHACGKGPLVPAQRHPDYEPDDPFAVEGVCSQCGAKKSFRFVCDRSPARAWPESEYINPTDEPSRMIGLAQWLSLFYTLIEHATAQGPVASRRTGLHAALCLEEAMKFYDPDDELPDESAFLTEKGRQAFHDQPEKFAQTRLRGMRDKLPSLDSMTRRVAKDIAPPRKRWWEFWK